LECNANIKKREEITIDKFTAPGLWLLLIRAEGFLGHAQIWDRPAVYENFGHVCSWLARVDGRWTRPLAAFSQNQREVKYQQLMLELDKWDAPLAWRDKYLMGETIREGEIRAVKQKQTSF
jgi:hypothetical protein